MAYSILWESFRVIAIAASCTHFAQEGAEREPLEAERTQIERVLKPPYLDAADLEKITLLKNGETLAGAITRLSSHSSRELKDIYGIQDTHTITDMEAFMQGIMEFTGELQPDGSWKEISERDAWFVTARDNSGVPLEADSPFSVEKYRSVIKWHCYQIRHNLNYVGKSEGSIDDAILIIRAFCLLEPIVNLLLHESRRKILFAL